MSELRSLQFGLRFVSDTSGLQDMNSSVDEVKENVGVSTENIEQMESSTTKLGQTTEKQGGIISRNWLKITAGLTAVSAGAEKLTRDNNKLTESLARVSYASGMQKDELKNLALEITNITHPLEDVTKHFEIATQQGLRSADELKDFANFWSNVSDATGLAGPQLAEASSGLRAVGISAGEEMKAINAFGYITQSTTSDVSEFLLFLDRTGAQIRELGLDIDDSAAMLGILEHEFGMSGRTARQEFRKGVNEADGDLNKMLDTLGISQKMFDDYSKKVSDSSTVIDENAKAHAESYTVMQRLSQTVKELSFRFSDTIGTIASLAPALLIVTPLIKALSVAKTHLAGVNMATLVPSLTASATAVWGFTTALLANPITWVVVAVVGLSVAIWALYKDIGGVTTKLKAIFSKISNWFNRTIGRVIHWLRDFPKKVRDSITGAVRWVTDKLTGLWTWLKKIPSKIVQIGKDIIDGLISGITSKFTELKDSIIEVGEKITGWFKGILGISSPSTIFADFGGNIMDGLMRGMRERYTALKNTVSGLAGNVSGWFRDKLGISSPSKVMIEAGLETGKGVEIGLDKSGSGVQKQAEKMSQNITKSFHSRRDIINSKRQQGDFRPTLNITVKESKDAKETAREIKLQFERLMSQYNKRENLRYSDV